jgi:hypothetical protein
VAERLFHGDVRSVQQAHPPEVLDDRREQGGRHFQVVQRPIVRADRVGQRGVELTVGDVAVHVVQPAREPVEHFVVDLLAAGVDSVAGPVDELIDGHVIAGHA